MESAPTVKDKLAYFRIKELKDVLTQLGLPKQGKKQELVDKILSLLSDDQGSRSHSWAKKNSMGKDGVVKIIDDTYRKMQIPGATDLASKSQSSSDINQVKPKEEVRDLYQEMKVSCPCGSTLITDSMIQCEEPKCKLWQHINCVIIPEKPMEGVRPEVPQCFYCEVCRLNRADPFWDTARQPLRPTKLAFSGISSDGANSVQCVEKTYLLSRADEELLQRSEYDLQVWCMLLNDKVPFRMQWPQNTDLQINGVPVRTTNRPAVQLLGINGRDDGPLITTCSREGVNKICLSRSDARTFSFGIRIAKRRTLQQVLSMVPKETDGERFEDAFARVCRCIGGGNATDNADSDSDVEVVADSVTVNLRCPMSGSRIKIAGRFRPCVHMGCFDLETFVELNQRSRKWQCPICLKNYSLESIVIDPYFNRITSLMRNCGEDVCEIDVKPDGSWRAKSEGDCRDLARWHLPDGSLSTAMNGEVKCGMDISKHIKQEDVSVGQTGLKLGIRKNHNGKWELHNKVAEDARAPSSGNHVQEKLGKHFQNLMPMSSSATGSYKDGEDGSVNQDGGNFDFSLNNVHDLDSISLNFDPTYDVEDRIPPAPTKDADIIVLSDSDEEDNANAPATDSNIISFPSNHPRFGEAYSEDPALKVNGTAFGPFSNENDDFILPMWPLPTYSQAGPTFQLFGSDANGSDALIDVQQNSLSPLNSYGLASNGGIGESSQAQDLPTCTIGMEANGSLVDNPLAYDSNDPSLQIFLPSQPAHPPQADLSDHSEMANGDAFDSWISLSLGGAGAGNIAPASSNGLKSKQQFTAQENDTASLLLSMNGDRGQKTSSNIRKSDGPFSHPRQPRSVRPRLYLSIDSESD
ncbi:E3 SUMO-protein ligase SIZ1-like isoform X2 [Asparagus officinalis]|uniref:E3 SUMO-protein ligase SIZ1-like isoform X2 n=1 Tax=Asparagus officinalis TaxID=4686 RepID=UPI00098E6E42|nr:E3 SUMO-protein ligase SIZ1-like isoform X2 [Asparagus officinalis]XP_020252663.1 E3 SUMO-protein ligase SIZ1-like isoform X2 [Asparagus officinalis]